MESPRYFGDAQRMVRALGAPPTCHTCMETMRPVPGTGRFVCSCGDLDTETQFVFPFGANTFNASFHFHGAAEKLPQL
jgi:hypothetical protein